MSNLWSILDANGHCGQIEAPDGAEAIRIARARLGDRPNLHVVPVKRVDTPGRNLVRDHSRSPATLRPQQ